MSLNSGAHRGQFNDTVFEVLGAENSKNDVVELWGGRGGHGGREVTGEEFNDTVFEVLGAENSKNDVVELWGGGWDGRSPGRSSTTLFLRFWGLKAPKTMSLNSGGGGGGHGGREVTEKEFNDTVLEVLGAENSQNDVVELWGGGVGVTGDGRSPGRSSTTPFLRFWGLKNSKNDVVEL